MYVREGFDPVTAIQRIDLDDFRPLPEAWRNACISIGNFDGVHLGHLELIRRLRAMAMELGPSTPALAVTFDPHPIQVLRPGQAPHPLCDSDRKVELLLEAGATGVVVFRTGSWLLRLGAREFFDRVIMAQFGARGLVEGPTFGFGQDRSGTVETLAEWCREERILFQVAKSVEGGGGIISSSRIRRALHDGVLDQANAWLGRPHRLEGYVIHGAARGRALGFPTANLGDVRQLIPSDGVYAAIAHVEGFDQSIGAAIHIGPNATFGEQGRSVEAHLLDFNEEIYGRKILLDLVAYLRPSVAFQGVEALLTQIRDDVTATRSALSAMTETILQVPTDLQ